MEIMTEKPCAVCGTLFTVRRVTQKYCSPACRRRANRTDGIVARDAWESEGKEIRHFACIRCGTVVRVTSTDDHRTKFCSRRCEKLYWKHSHKVEAKLVEREFKCSECGRLVVVTDPKDLRQRFCSGACATKYFSHHRKTAKRDQ